MLKTYRIIPLVFILFLFGFTFITVSLVSADERDAFVQCQQMPTQPNNFKSLKRQKNCFRDVAKRLGAKKREGAFGACQRVSTQKMQQKIDCFMDVASSLMPNTAPPAGAIGMPPTMAAPPAASPAAPQRNGFARRGGIMGGNNAPLPPRQMPTNSWVGPQVEVIKALSKVLSEPCQFAWIKKSGERVPAHTNRRNEAGNWRCSDGCTMGYAMGASKTASALGGDDTHAFCVPIGSKSFCDTIRKKGYKHRTLMTRDKCGIPGATVDEMNMRHPRMCAPRLQLGGDETMCFEWQRNNRCDAEIPAGTQSDWGPGCTSRFERPLG